MAGRPNKYFTHVKPRFGEIAEWLESGATEKEICDNLGINAKVFCKYKNEHKELNDLVKNARRKPVQAIKAALFKRATGYHYTETTTVNSEKGTQTTTYNKYLPPDPASAMILLKHWDKETEWTQDPATLKLKKEEFEYKKEHAESEVW